MRLSYLDANYYRLVLRLHILNQGYTLLSSKKESNKDVINKCCFSKSKSKFY